MDETKLLPCPFCGSDKVILRPEDNDTWGHIRCLSCNALGPPACELNAINAAWNGRVQVSANARNQR